MIFMKYQDGELDSTIISQTFSKNLQEMNIVQSWEKKSGFRSYKEFEHILFFRISPEYLNLKLF